MIVLIGFMGAGKTTVGRLVAAKVGLPFLDTDELVSGRAGLPIVDIFEQRGEPAFRELEREVVLEALQGKEAVISLGGGSLGDPAVATLLQGKDVIHLDVTWGEAAKRLRGDETRPVFRDGDPKALFESRQHMYEMVRKRTVPTDGRPPDEIARDIAVSAKGSVAAMAQPQRVVISLGDRSYEVVVGRELLESLVDFLPPKRSAEKAFVITHPRLERLAKEASTSLASAGLVVEHLTVEEGERSKSLGVVQRLWGELATKQAHRTDFVIGIGGGVICDVAGFVAATYGRGMPLVHVPTTLLAQVDAAIGGKCGVNIPQGKNLIGAIYQPSKVLCDVDILASLPEEEFRSGMAEVVKYGLIADPDLLEGLGERYKLIYDGRAPQLIELVARCASIKASFVSGDERDEGRRAFLNYGHTFAHAIERLAGYAEIRHGEAVALGMMTAAYLAQELGRLTEHGVQIHRRVLSSIGLPITADLDLDALEDAWQHDKKYDAGVRFVLLNGIGKPEAGIEVERGAIGAALRRMAP